jgi:integrating conjugative element protein (TIGR03746 family)
MRFQNALENARLALQILATAFLISVAINILLIIGWHSAQSKVNVYIPPQIPQSGITLQAGIYPAASIYSFAYYIWQGINHWSTNGVDDYKETIEQFAPFLTPRFKNFLIHDYNERFNQGELQKRIRTLAGLNGTAFQSMDVQTIGNGIWIVHLKMRLSEHMNMNSNEVKDVAIEYVLRVVRYDVDAKANPWGLALDGFITNPQRIQTYV